MKKYILMTILMAIVLLLTVSIASAAVTFTAFSSSSPTFGSDSQMASNPNADDVADEDIYDTGDVSLTSVGAGDTITGITVSAESGFSNTDTGSDGYIDITLTDADLTLAADTAEGIQLTARIPERLDAVSSSLDEVAIKVATVTFAFTTSADVDVDVYMQRKNMLTIDDLDISINGQSEDLDDGDDTDDVKPGDDIEVVVKAENLYDDNDDDVEIEDVELTVEIDDNDLDVDEDDDIGDINADDKETGTISFSVDNDADDDNYDMEIFVDGDDEHGAKHGEKWTIDFNVERNNHEIIIKTATISQDTVSCTRGSNSISVKLYNIGKNDEDEVALYVTSTALGIKYEQENFDLDESDDMTKTVSFTVSDSLAAGTYPIRAKVYFSGDEDDGVLGDLVDVDLVVEACAITTTTTDTTVDVVTLTDDAVATLTADSIVEEDVTETVEKPFTESWLYATVLIAGVVVAAGWLVFLVLKLLVFV